MSGIRYVTISEPEERSELLCRHVFTTNNGRWVSKWINGTSFHPIDGMEIEYMGILFKNY